MTTSSDQRRRHDEQVQQELMGGMQRILDVLHDISDGVRDIRTAIDAAQPSTTDSGESEPGPILLSISGAAALTGIKEGSFRRLCDSSYGPVTVRVGRRIYVRRTDLEAWLDEARHDPTPASAPWRTSFTPGRIGASVVEAGPVDRSWCAGSHTEPSTASPYHGRGLCRVCRDDVLINRDGRLRKHRRPSW